MILLVEGEREERLGRASCYEASRLSSISPPLMLTTAYEEPQDSRLKTQDSGPHWAIRAQSEEFVMSTLARSHAHAHASCRKHRMSGQPQPMEREEQSSEQ